MATANSIVDLRTNNGESKTDKDHSSTSLALTATVPKPKSNLTSKNPSAVPVLTPGNGPMFFYEDEIFRVTRNGNIEFGMVMENWEMYSSSEESEDEDDMESSDKVPKGHVAISWHPSGNEGVVAEHKVHLSDRSLMPGDVVRRLISGKDTQRGYARSVKVSATVQTVGGSNHIIKNIPASKLKSVQEVRSDTSVYLDSWMGIVRDVRYYITLRFNDNSICIIDSEDIDDHFEDVHKAFNNSYRDTFYPGQKFRGPIKYLRKAEWINCSDELRRAKDRKMVKGTVTQVELKDIHVNWQWKTPVTGPGNITQPQKVASDKKLEVVDETTIPAEFSRLEADSKLGPSLINRNSSTINTVPTYVNLKLKCDENAQTGENKKLIANLSANFPNTETDEDTLNRPPPSFVSGDALNRIRFLNLFESCSVQLGDISFYTPTPDDIILKKKSWKKDLKSKLSSTITSVQIFDAKINDTEDSDSETEANSENGTRDKASSDNAETDTPRIGSNKEISTSQNKKCFPRVATRLLRKKKLKRARRPISVSYGSPTQWVVETLHTSSIVDVVWQDGTVEEGMRSVDLYPIHHLDDHEFFPGDFVMKIENAAFGVYGVIQTMDHNGRVAIVKWFQNYSGPPDEERIPKELETEEVSVYDIRDHVDFRFRPGTIVFRTANFIPDQCPAGQVMDNYPSGKVQVWWGKDLISCCWPQDLFTVREYDSDEGEGDLDWVPEKKDGASDSGSCSSDSWETDEEDIDTNLDTPQNSSAQLFSPATDESLKEKAVLSESAIAVPSESVNALNLSSLSLSQSEPSEHFTVLETVPESHKYRHTTFEPMNPKRFAKTVQKEMKFLKDDLPPGIYVKGYEDRMDLFSVMIHGPENTPYQDGLFFFDVQLPSNYPDEPPSVYYIAFCTSRLNPNLYECGKVCVSLLGTWSGRGTEVWTSDSTILQLLISIQGLILVPEPYYNEAGYEKQKGSQQGMENSRMYNEMVLIKLVQSMTKMLKYPPAPWQIETTKHILEKGPRLVARYQKWLADSEAPIPETDETLSGNENAEILDLKPSFPLFPVSKGFSITLKKMLDSFKTLCMSYSNSTTNAASPIGTVTTA